MRYVTTMRKRSEFGKAVRVTTGFMVLMYLLVGVTGYTIFGVSIDTSKPITSVLSKDVWSVVMNAGAFELEETFTEGRAVPVSAAALTPS